MQKAAPHKGAGNALPVELDITLDQFNDYYPTWLQWRATDRRFLPTELRGQPQALMDGLLSIDAIFEKIVAQIMEQEKGK